MFGCRHLSIVSIVSLAATSACTGLAAGPEASAQTPVPVSRDTAWARARRAVATESFTLDVVDSTRGRMVGTRYPSSNAKLGSPTACRMTLALTIEADGPQAQLNSTSRWLAPEQMLDNASQLCERERTQVLERIYATVVPPAQ